MEVKNTNLEEIRTSYVKLREEQKELHREREEWTASFLHTSMKTVDLVVAYKEHYEEAQKQRDEYWVTLKYIRGVINAVIDNYPEILEEDKTYDLIIEALNKANIT